MSILRCWYPGVRKWCPTVPKAWNLAKEKPRRLIRWEYIRAAEVFEHKLDMEQVVGFRPHAA